MDRFDSLRRNLPKDGRGVEIGPFFSPTIAKRDGWRTIVVDFADAERLRMIARTHAAEVIRAAEGRIEDVDIVWDGQSLDEAVFALTGGEKVDFVVASHVIEHTTDFLRFLRECSRMLTEDGIISLAVPDMRKCFDLLKTPTSTAEVLAANRQGRVRHPPETIFAAVAYATKRAGAGAWVEGTRAPLEFVDGLLAAKLRYEAELEKGPADAYTDAHEWYFTPAGFELVMLELNAMGYIDFAIDSLETNPGSEFIVQLRRRPVTLGADALAQRRMELALRRYREFAEEVGFEWQDAAPAAPVAAPAPRPRLARRIINRLRRWAR